MARMMTAVAMARCLGGGLRRRARWRRLTRGRRRRQRGFVNPKPTRESEPEPLTASRAILPEMKHAVDMAIMELRSSHPAPLDAEDAVSELVGLWAYFPIEIDEPAKAGRIAQIEFLSNRSMAEIGDHEELIRLFRSKFRARFGDHLSADRIDALPG